DSHARRRRLFPPALRRRGGRWNSRASLPPFRRFPGCPGPDACPASAPAGVAAGPPLFCANREEWQMRVLACDGIHPEGLALFRQAGWEVEESEAIKDPKVLAARLENVDAVLVRSATPVPAEALARATALKVIGRAGAGVDTIDVDAATARGIAVMNAPDGNTLAAAEHALALLFALARHVPRADSGMKQGQWPKAGLTGFELE